MSTATITMALLMGFTGSLHCAGMCGPIVFIMPFQAFAGLRKALALGLYHLGRISVYALLATVLYSFRSLFQPAVQQYISMAMGIIMLLAGAWSFLSHSVFRWSLPWEEPVKRRLGSLLGNPGLGGIFAAGALNGLLPCGLVYIALSASVMLPSVAQAAGMMYLFGLGTAPMLIGLSLLRQRMQFLRVANVRRMAPVVVVFFGALFLLRGLNLGIPYLSPKVSVTAHSVKASCCHKK